MTCWLSFEGLVAMNSGERRFAHLLQPIRDLTKNWDVDLATQLGEYLEEVSLLSFLSKIEETFLIFSYSSRRWVISWTVGGYGPCSRVQHGCAGIWIKKSCRVLCVNEQHSACGCTGITLCDRSAADICVFCSWTKWPSHLMEARQWWTLLKQHC